MTSPDIYGEHWDHFVRISKPDVGKWPGDEWGKPEAWDRLFKQMFVDFGVSTWTKCVEIGAGSGKYTLKVLEHSQAQVIAADVSAEFQRVFCERLIGANQFERVFPLLLDADSTTLFRFIGEKGWIGSLDGFYSMDAMVHVDLQHLIAYLVTAAASLRPGGKLIMTLANCCSDRGFAKLIADTRNAFRRMGRHSGKFEWLSPDAVTSVLTRLNFEIDVLNTAGRDIMLVASLRQPLTDPAIRSCIE